jgi:hypothetical protein
MPVSGIETVNVRHVNVVVDGLFRGDWSEVGLRQVSMRATLLRDAMEESVVSCKCVRLESYCRQKELSRTFILNV